MNIYCQNISQDDIDYAIECLEFCKQEDAKEYGFNYPFFAPGGYYGKQWWQIDSSLALCGYKWIDRKFTEISLWNFIESQKEDGRICLWGEDELPEFGGKNKLKQRHGVSSLPKIFDVAYHILQGSKDAKLKIATYNMLKKYIDWWFCARYDEQTGLVSSVFEETFIPYLGSAGEYAAVDTNTEVYVGCHYTALLAEELGKADDAVLLNIRKEKLRESINQYLWDDAKGAYYPYDLKEKCNVDCLMGSTFYPLRLHIATDAMKEKLIALLQNDAYFNWNTIPLTSVAKNDKLFQTTEGTYQGNASWSGNVWTLINEMVIRGLIDCGEDELAAELAFKTLFAFKSNCAEFLHPFDGTGHGVEKYAWTASQFIELLVEVIFGVRYQAAKEEIIVSPKLPQKLKKCRMSIENLKIDSDTSITICINDGKVSCAVSNDKIKVIC